MKKTNELISNFYQNQKQFGYLQSVNLHRNISNEGCSEYTLNVTLCNYPFYEGNEKLVLSFSRARNIKIGDMDGLFKLLISIIDISENQMEGINYRVKEEENEIFSFYCEDFEFKII